MKALDFVVLDLLCEYPRILILGSTFRVYKPIDKGAAKKDFALLRKLIRRTTEQAKKEPPHA